MPGAVDLCAIHRHCAVNVTIGRSGTQSALDDNQHFLVGSKVQAGKVIYEAVATALEVEFTPAGDLLI